MTRGRHAARSRRPAGLITLLAGSLVALGGVIGLAANSLSGSSGYPLGPTPHVTGAARAGRRAGHGGGRPFGAPPGLPGRPGHRRAHQADPARHDQGRDPAGPDHDQRGGLVHGQREARRDRPGGHRRSCRLGGRGGDLLPAEAAAARATRSSSSGPTARSPSSSSPRSGATPRPGSRPPRSTGPCRTPRSG